MRFNNIVLAAGRSSRMGVPKPLLKVNSSFQMIDKIDKAKSCGAVQSVVVLGYHEARLRNFFTLEDRSDVRVIRNTNPAADQTSSMKSALAVLDLKLPVLMQIVDQPPLLQQTLNTIVSSGNNLRKIRVPVYQGSWGHPPFYPSWFLKEIVKMSEDRGINSLYSFFQDKIETVPVDQREVLLDFDTPVDFIEYQGGNL